MSTIPVPQDPIVPFGKADARIDFRKADTFEHRELLKQRFEAIRPPPKPAPPADYLELLAQLANRRAASRDEATALAEMDLLLAGAPVVREDGDNTVTRDAPVVNDPGDTTEGAARHEAATRQVEANAGVEEARLEQLTPEERAQYESVKQACLAADDPVAALALQKLLFEGKLPGETDLAGEGTVLDHLAGVADGTVPLDGEVDRGALLTDLVQELATPAAINQGFRGTCAPTAASIDLVIEHPAEYARIVLGLGSPEGEVTLAGGAVLMREPETSFEPDGTGRALTQRIVAPAFMEMSNGARNYDDATGAGEGAWSNDLDPLYEQLFGRPFEETRLNTPEARADAIGIIDEQLATGRQVPVAITWGTGLHKVLITGRTVVNGEVYYTVINPWGREERIRPEDLEPRLRDINYEPAAERTRDHRDLGDWLAQVA